MLLSHERSQTYKKSQENNYTSCRFHVEFSHYLWISIEYNL